MPTSSETVSPEEFRLYYEHNPPQGDAELMHWSGQRYNDFLRALGVDDPHVTDEDVALIRFCYQLASRSFHVTSHAEFVGNSEIRERLIPENNPLLSFLEGTRYADPARAEAVMTIAGDFHDTAYMHVDADSNGGGAFSSFLTTLIDGVAVPASEVVAGERIHRVELTEKGRNDPLTQMVAHIFGVPEGGSLTHKQGGNEFASALAAVQFLKKHGMDEKDQPLEQTDLIAVAAIIACTIPFRPNATVDEAGNLQDGFVEGIGRRVQQLLLQAGEDESTVWHTTNAIMAMGVYVANRDTSPFTLPDNWAALTYGGNQLKAEEVRIDGEPVLRKTATTISELLFSAQVSRFSPALYNLILQGTVPPHVTSKFFVPFDTYGQLSGLEYSYPPQKVHNQGSDNSKENARLSLLFSKIHELGIAFAACVASLIGEPSAEVPGIVDSETAPKWLMPEGGAIAEPEVDPDFTTLYNGLAGKKGSMGASKFNPEKAPLSAFMLATVGLNKALRLSAIVHTDRVSAPKHEERHLYADQRRARGYVDAVLEQMGPANFNKLLGIMVLAAIRYAPHRVDGIRGLMAPEPGTT